MFYKLKVDATRVFLFMEIAIGMFVGMVFVTNSLYEATVAGLAPLQLVLVQRLSSQPSCLRCPQGSSPIFIRGGSPLSSVTY